MAKKDKKETKNSKDKTSFFKSFKAELKKVIWPTPKQLVNNTIAVLTIVLITAVIVFVLDLTFETLNKYGLDKIKEIVSNSTVDENLDNTLNNTIDNTIDGNSTIDNTAE